MTENHIFLDFRLSKSGIISYLSTITNPISKKDSWIDGYTIKIMPLATQKTSLQANGKIINTTLPLGIQIRKDAGLFTTEGEAEILISIGIAFDILPDGKATVESSLGEYQWISEPSMKVGSLDITIEKIANFVIKHMKESILDKLDQFIMSKLDLKPVLSEQINVYGRNYILSKNPSFYFNFYLLEIVAGDIFDDDTDIHIDLWLHANIKISDEPLRQPIEPDITFTWVKTPLDKVGQSAELIYTYDGLAILLLQTLNGVSIGGKSFDIESLTIAYHSKLIIQAKITSPIKGRLTISGLPYLSVHEQKIYVKNIQTEVLADNLVYKLSSPWIESMLTTKIAAFLPYDISVLWSKYLKKLPTFHVWSNQFQLSPKIEDIKLEDISFETKSIKGNLILANPVLDIVLNEKRT